MGYYTDYSVSISGFKDRDEAEFFEFKEIHKVNGMLYDICKSASVRITHDLTVAFDLNQWKWYNWQSELEALSKKYPHLLFNIEGVGEEFPDIWKARIRNNVTEVVNAEISFPDFKIIC